MRASLCSLLLLGILLSCSSNSAEAQREAAATDSDPTVIYLLRHAEKDDTAGDDPPLLPAGEDRAQNLAEQLAEEKISAVYATPYARTEATARPLARTQSLDVTPYPADASPDRQVADWLQRHRGQTIVVVGHSNTIPGLVNALIGERRFGDIDESVYDRLFKVIIASNGTATVEELRTRG
jgi:broad specificity phosphatase PhoE